MLRPLFSRGYKVVFYGSYLLSYEDKCEHTPGLRL
jgi:hypothetical protein